MNAALYEIPPITDPLGKHWQQPDPREILIDDDHALMTRATFEQLLEYSTSIPSGKYIGKMFKSRRFGCWYLRWYDHDPDPTILFIECRTILLVD